jgi:hypothetical protein
MDLTELYKKRADHGHARLLLHCFPNYRKTLTIIQDCVRLARSYELINIIHCVGSLRINCFNFKLAFVLLRWIIYALAYILAIAKMIIIIVDRTDYSRI